MYVSEPKFGTYIVGIIAKARYHCFQMFDEPQRAVDYPSPTFNMWPTRTVKNKDRGHWSQQEVAELVEKLLKN
jgi:hypothetical protein